MYKLDLEKAEEPEIKLPTSTGSLKKQESSRKTSTFCFIDYAKAFDCVDHNKLWKILKEIGIPDHLTCLLRHLYVGQEAAVGVFMELSCIFSDPTGVGNLIFGSSAFSKSSLNFWKLMVHLLLKPGLENFEHYFASV